METKNYVGKIVKCIDEKAPCYKSQGVILNQIETGDKLILEFVTLDKGLCNISFKPKKEEFKDFFSTTVMDKLYRNKLTSLSKRYKTYLESKSKLDALQAFVSSEHSEITKTIDNLGCELFYNQNSIGSKIDEVYSKAKNRNGLDFCCSVSTNNEKNISAFNLNVSKTLMRYANESSFPFLYEEYDGTLFISEGTEKEQKKYFIKKFKGIEKTKNKLFNIEVSDCVDTADRDVYAYKDIHFSFKNKTYNRKDIIDNIFEEIIKVINSYL